MFLLLFLTFICLLSPFVLGECPNGLRVRKEFRDMSASEWNAFKSALFKLYTITIDGNESLIDRFTRVLNDNRKIAEQSPYRLPWMRYFLRMLERELEKLDPSVTVPYWVNDAIIYNFLLVIVSAFWFVFIGLDTRCWCLESIPIVRHAVPGCPRTHRL
jgi:hypothetical protein